MKNLSLEEAMTINGGATYYCPFGCDKQGDYWSVYWHCLSSGCFKRNGFLRACWEGAKFCFGTAFTNELTRVLNCSMIKGKHAR